MQHAGAPDGHGRPGGGRHRELRAGARPRPGLLRDERQREGRRGDPEGARVRAHRPLRRLVRDGRRARVRAGVPGPRPASRARLGRLAADRAPGPLRGAAADRADAELVLRAALRRRHEPLRPGRRRARELPRHDPAPGQRRPARRRPAHGAAERAGVPRARAPDRPRSRPRGGAARGRPRRPPRRPDPAPASRRARRVEPADERAEPRVRGDELRRRPVPVGARDAGLAAAAGARDRDPRAAEGRVRRVRVVGGDARQRGAVPRLAGLAAARRDPCRAVSGRAGARRDRHARPALARRRGSRAARALPARAPRHRDQRRPLRARVEPVSVRRRGGPELAERPAGADQLPPAAAARAARGAPPRGRDRPGDTGRHALARREDDPRGRRDVVARRIRADPDHGPRPAGRPAHGGQRRLRALRLRTRPRRRAQRRAAGRLLPVERVPLPRRRPRQTRPGHDRGRSP